LTESERHAVVVLELKDNGDPWRLNEEAKPGKRTDDVSDRGRQ